MNVTKVYPAGGGGHGWTIILDSLDDLKLLEKELKDVGYGCTMIDGSIEIFSFQKEKLTAYQFVQLVNNIDVDFPVLNFIEVVPMKTININIKVTEEEYALLKRARNNGVWVDTIAGERKFCHYNNISHYDDYDQVLVDSLLEKGCLQRGDECFDLDPLLVKHIEPEVLKDKRGWKERIKKLRVGGSITISKAEAEEIADMLGMKLEDLLH